MTSQNLNSLERSLLPWGYGAAFAASALNVLWLICLITLESRGDVSVQAGSSPALFRLSVGSALILACFQVPILLSMVVLAAGRDSARALIGGVFYSLYIPINLIGYFSFGRLAPIVHAPPFSGEPSALVVAGLVEIGHPLGLTGNLPILGYGLLGLAWCLLSSALWSRGGMWKVVCSLLFVSGFLSVLGGIGAFVDSRELATCCFLGGVVSFPALLMLGFTLRREKASS